MAHIPIVDDAINEAAQVFIVELRLVSCVDSARFNLTTQPSSLCKIIDNDRKYNNAIDTAMRATLIFMPLMPLHL